MADTITLTWNDRKFFIARDKVMRARQVIENEYSLKELATHMQQGNPHLVRLSVAYGSLLRFAGAHVDDEEVYDGMFAEGKELGALAADMLLQILVPESMRVQAGKDGQPANPTPRSKTSSKSVSAKAG
jgi:hypothetical protein